MKSRLLIAITLAALLAPATLLAQTTAPTPPSPTQTAPPPAVTATPDPEATSPGFLKACKADVDKLCGTAPRSEIRACIRKSEDKLSAPCKEFVAAARQRQQAFRAACGSDIKALCAKDTRGGKVRECLQTNEAKLSPTCKTELASNSKPAKK